MQEPKLYERKSNGGFIVAWYEQGKRIRKCFADPIQAQLLYQEKLNAAPIDKEVLILKEIATIKKYVTAGKIQEIEADNTRLKDELAALKSTTVSIPRAEEQSSVSPHRLLFDREIAQRFGLSIAIVVERLRWLLTSAGVGKILSDGCKYVFNTYSDWQKNHFPFWSERTIERIFIEAENKALMISKQPEGRASRRKYYTLTAEGAKLAASGTKCRFPSAQNGVIRKPPVWCLPNSENESTADAVSNAGTVGSADAAAAATLGLIQELQKRYQRHNVKVELNRYANFCRTHGKQPTAEGFKRWMARAEMPIELPKRVKPAIISQDPPRPLDEIGSDTHVRFLRELAERKAKKAVA
jgi:hypothetical protein